MLLQRTLRLALLALAVLGLASRAAAFQAPAVVQVAESCELDLAGRTVFTFHAPRLGYTAEQRCTAARALLHQILEHELDLTVAAQPSDEGQRILVGGHETFSVLTADVDVLAGETLESLAATTVQRLDQALREAREARGLRGWLVALGRSALTLALAALVIWVLLRNHRLLSAKLAELCVRKSQLLSSSGLRLLGQQNLLPLAKGLATLVTGALVALVVYIAAHRLLLHFPYSRPVGERLKEELFDEVRTLALALAQSLPDLAIVVLLYLCARFGTGVVRRYFLAAARGQVQSHLAEAVTPQVAERLISALVWLGALIVAFPYIPGSGTGAFKGVSVFAGLMVSLGSSSLVGQMASGLVLAYSRAFRVGDMVRFGEHEGVVVGFGLLATKIRTPHNEEINVPNSVLTTATTVNYSRFNDPDGVFLCTKLTLGYDIPWRRIHELFLGAARRTDGVRAEPAPHVLQTALSDFYVEYQLRAVAVDPVQRPEVLSRLLANVLSDFEAGGVVILSPHHMHLHGRVDPGATPPRA